MTLGALGEDGFASLTPVQRAGVVLGGCSMAALAFTVWLRLRQSIVKAVPEKERRWAAIRRNCVGFAQSECAILVP